MAVLKLPNAILRQMRLVDDDFRLTWWTCSMAEPRIGQRLGRISIRTAGALTDEQPQASGGPSDSPSPKRGSRWAKDAPPCLVNVYRDCEGSAPRP